MKTVKGIKRNMDIRIRDWAGNTLFEGDHEDEEVLRIFKLNEYKTANGDTENECYAEWVDEDGNDDLNIYEYIYF